MLDQNFIEPKCKHTNCLTNIFLEQKMNEAKKKIKKIQLKRQTFNKNYFGPKNVCIQHFRPKNVGTKIFETYIPWTQCLPGPTFFCTLKEMLTHTC